MFLLITRVALCLFLTVSWSPGGSNPQVKGKLASNSPVSPQPRPFTSKGTTAGHQKARTFLVVHRLELGWLVSQIQDSSQHSSHAILQPPGGPPEPRPQNLLRLRSTEESGRLWKLNMLIHRNRCPTISFWMAPIIRKSNSSPSQAILPAYHTLKTANTFPLRILTVKFPDSSRAPKPLTVLNDLP